MGVPRSDIRSQLLDIRETVVVSYLFRRVFQRVREFVRREDFSDGDFLLQVFFPVTGSPTLVRSRKMGSARDVRYLVVVFT